MIESVNVTGHIDEMFNGVYLRNPQDINEKAAFVNCNDTWIYWSTIGNLNWGSNFEQRWNFKIGPMNIEGPGEDHEGGYGLATEYGDYETDLNSYMVLKDFESGDNIDTWTI